MRYGIGCAALLAALASTGHVEAQDRVELRLGAPPDVTGVADPDERLGRWIEHFGAEAEAGRLVSGTLGLILGAAQAVGGTIAFVEQRDADPSPLYLGIGFVGLLEVVFGVVQLAVSSGDERRRDRWRAERASLDEAERYRFEGELRASADVDRTERDVLLALGVGGLALGGVGVGVTAWLAEDDTAAFAGYSLAGAIGLVGVYLMVLGLLDSERAADLQQHENGLAPRVSLVPSLGPTQGGLTLAGSF